MANKPNNGETVHRFNFGFRLSHWLNAAAFLVLYVSGLPLYSNFFDWLYIIFGSPEAARIVHRVAAVAFVLPLPILLIFDFKGLVNWTKNLFSWKKHDFQFFKTFFQYFFGRNPKPPKQDFFNAGEKLNSWLMITTSLMLMLSGFVMWFPQFFSAGIINWAYPIHNIGLGIAFAVVIGHIYMSVVLNKASLRGITKGDIDKEYAKKAHGRWYDELVEKGVVQDEDKTKGA